jgi:hypothetical protein
MFPPFYSGTSDVEMVFLKNLFFIEAFVLWRCDPSPAMAFRSLGF